MKIVVIGGSGLIGKKLVKLLGERGHKVVAASPSTGVARNLPAIAYPAHRGDRPPRFSSARTVSCQGHGPV